MMDASMTRPVRMILAALALPLCLAACGEEEAADASPGEPLVSVQVVEVERRELQAWVYSQGTARARQREFLTFTREGQVTFVDPELRVGSPVEAGRLIAHQEQDRGQADLQAARAAASEAEANVRLATLTRERYQTLIEQRSASRQELDQAVVQLEQAKAARDSARVQVVQAELAVDESRLVSPIDGVLARLNVEQGRYFSPGTVQTGTEQGALSTVPALVIDPSQFEIRVDLPSYEFRRVQAGARAVIGGTPPANGNEVDPLEGGGRISGQVHAVSPSLDPESRTFEIIVRTDEPDPPLQDGEFVGVWLAEPALQSVLSLPLDSVRFREDQAFVFVVDPESGRVSEREIEHGQPSGGYLPVRRGLEEGELVATAGRGALTEGQQVRILGGAGAAP